MGRKIIVIASGGPFDGQHEGDEDKIDDLPFDNRFWAEIYWIGQQDKVGACIAPMSNLALQNAFTTGLKDAKRPVRHHYEITEWSEFPEETLIRVEYVGNQCRPKPDSSAKDQP